MAKNEAKIKFTAETADFTKAVDKANTELAGLRKETKLNSEQMKTAGVSVEGLEKNHSLLEAQLKASHDKTEALSAKVDAAARIYGENSTEVQKWKQKLTDAEIAEEKIRQAINKCNSEIEKQAAAEKKTESATENLTNTIEKQQSEVDRLKKEYADVVLQHGKNSKEAKDLAKQIDKLSDDLQENKAKLNEAENAADKLDNTFDDLGNTSESVGSKMKNVAVGVGAVAAAAVAAGKSAIDAFNEVDDGADNVIKATGATGEAAAELEQSYKNVASSIVGDFGDIGSALGEVNTRFGYTGSDAETATKQFLKFSEVTGMDATEAVKAVSRAIESAGLETSDYGSILDSLTAVGQATGVSVDTLATSLTDYGASLRGMGYDTSDSIAMLAQFEKAGVDSATVIRGMRTAQAAWAKDGKDAKEEFAKLVSGIKDGSVTAGEAYEVFGSKAGAELIDAIKSGRFSYEEMVSVVEGSKGALDGTFDATIDGGYELDLAMQNAKMALAEAGEEVGTVLTPVFQGFSDTVLPALVQGFKDTVQFVKDACSWMKEHKGVMVAVASVIGVLTTAITAYNVVQGIKSAMDAAQVTTVWGLVAAHWAQATAAMAAMAPYILIVAAIAAVIAIIVLCVKYWDEIVAAVKKAVNAVVNTLKTVANWIYNNVIKPVGNFFTGLWNGIVSGFTAAWNWICGIFTSFVNWVNTYIVQPVIGFFTGLWNGIVNAFHTVIDPWIEIVKRAAALCNEQIIQPIKNFFVDLWNSIVSGLQSAWDWVVSICSTVANWINTNVIQPISNFFTSLWNRVVNGVKTAVNGVKNVFSTVANWVNSKVVQPISNFFTKLWNSFTNGAKKAWSGVKSVFSAVGDFFGGIFNTVKDKILSVFAAGGKIFLGIKDGIVNVFKTVVNAIIKGINKVISVPLEGLNKILNKIHNIEILGVSPFSWLTWRAPIPKIPLLAKGGIVDAPTLNIAGEAGPEAIIPIAKLQTYIYSAVDKALSAMNIQRLAQAIELLANRPINIYVNGRKFAEATAGDSDAVGGIRNVFKNRGLEID